VTVVVTRMVLLLVVVVLVVVGGGQATVRGRHCSSKLSLSLAGLVGFDGFDSGFRDGALGLLRLTLRELGLGMRIVGNPPGSESGSKTDSLFFRRQTRELG